MKPTAFEHELEKLRMNCAGHFRNAAEQLQDNPLGKRLPLRRIADVIDGVEDGLDKRLVARFNAIKEKELAKFGDDPSPADKIDMLMIDIEHGSARQEIIDEAREISEFFDITRYEAQDQLILKLEAVQKVSDQPFTLGK